MKINIYYYVAFFQLIFCIYNLYCEKEGIAGCSFVMCGVFWLFGILKDIQIAIKDLKK